MGFPGIKSKGMGILDGLNRCYIEADMSIKMDCLDAILKDVGLLDGLLQYYIEGDGYIGWTFSILY